MTYEEAIEILETEQDNCDIENEEAFKLAISALEENDKLKAEIEQLKARLQAELYKKDFKEFCDKREEEERNLKFREENKL